MKAVLYHIYLNEPAIFSKLEGDPNSAISYPYIPGSAMRGSLIGRFVKKESRQAQSFILDPGGDHKHLFFSAQTRYLNAYPLINSRRSLPIPVTWTVPKYKTQQELVESQAVFITDSAILSNQSVETRRKPKSLSGFAVLDGDTASTYKPATVVSVHNTRARRNAAEQQVFRYEALADGQTFMGAILCDTDYDAQQLIELLKSSPQIMLGGSRTAGYGSATISSIGFDPNWSEVEIDTRSTNEMILTFLSDTILRDGQGVYMPTANALRDQLQRMNIDCQIKPISIKTTWIGGFNRKWGLPLPQSFAIEQGSVVLLSDVKAGNDTIRRLLNDGIGERCEDGFGRIALNWQHQPQLIYAPHEPSREVKEVVLGEESKILLNTIRERMRDRQLEERIAGILYDKRYTIYGDISRTQLSRLRSMIADALRQDHPSRDVIATFINGIAGKMAGRQFDTARIDGQPLSEWLKNPTFQDIRQNITSNDYYVLRLVDMVLERAYRERAKQAQQEVN